MEYYKLKELLDNAKDNSVIKLEKNQIYDCYPEDSYQLEGYYFSNTQTLEENPKGYRPVAIYLKDKKNIVIDGNGSTLMIHGIMTPFLFDNIDGIELKNLKIDYYRPTMSEFKILSNDGCGTAFIKMNKESLYRIDGNKLYFVSEKNRSGGYYFEYYYRDKMLLSMYKDDEREWTRMMHYYDEFDSSVKFPCIPEFTSIDDMGDGILRVKLKNPKAFFKEGITVETRNTIRDQIGGCFIYSKDIYMHDMKIYAMHGLGILSQASENITYMNNEIRPKEGRKIASNADFFQVSGCKGFVHIAKNHLEEGHDDFINVHGTHLRIVGHDKNKLTLRFMNQSTFGYKAYSIGDEIELIDHNTLSSYDKAVVTSVKMTDLKTIEIELDKEVFPNIDDSIENVTMTPSVLIENNYFGPTCARGILCLTRKDCIIRNNTFFKTGGSVLCLEDDCNFWFESGRNKNVVFTNNHVIGCGYGFVGKYGNVPVILSNPQVIDKDYKGYVHERLEISGNRFEELPKDSYVLDIKYVGELEYLDNSSDEEIKLRLLNTTLKQEKEGDSK